MLRNIWRRLRQKTEEVRHKIWQKRLRQTDFTVISDNCWSGFISQYLNLPYRSPTVGLFFYPEDYLKFCSDLRGYLDQELSFIPMEKSKEYKRLVKNGFAKDPFPVGVLRDIEIYFMHYHSPQEALEKWNRRKARVNYDKLLFKVSERNDMTEETLRAFSRLPGNKVIFTQKKYDDMPDAIYVKELAQIDKQGAADTAATLKACNIVEILNSL